jgi:hypothetical protein
MSTLNPVTVVPVDLKPDDMLGYKIIAVIGFAGDWAAYAGLTDWSDEEVAGSGDKISREAAEAAEALFSAPKIAGLKYRGY